MKLSAGTAQMGLYVTSDQQEKLLHYLTLLHKWNGIYNLTAIRQPEQMVSNHLLDSLAVLPYLWPQRWLDVGWGRIAGTGISSNAAGMVVHIGG